MRVKLSRWFGTTKFYVLIGQGGVLERDPKRARKWGQIFSYGNILISILLLLEWQLQTKNTITLSARYALNGIIWSYFVVEFFLLQGLVRDRLRFMRENWLLPVVIVLGIPFVFNFSPWMTHLSVFRPLLAIWVLIPSVRLLSYFFLDGRLITTLLAAAVIVVVFGILVSGVDPAIRSVWDGIWWALATVSTVGYGDVVPVSFLGRLIAAMMVILGLGVFVVITANFLALTLRKEVRELHEEEQDIHRLVREVQRMSKTQDELLRLTKILSNRVARLEKEAQPSPRQQPGPVSESS